MVSIILHHFILINSKNNSLVLVEEDTFGINGSFGAPEKKFSIIFSKAKTKYCLSLHDNGGNSYLFVNKKKYKFKANTKNVNFPSRLCLGNISNNFFKESIFKRSVHDFWVDYDVIDQSDILNIRKCFMIKKYLLDYWVWADL